MVLASIAARATFLFVNRHPPARLVRWGVRLAVAGAAVYALAAPLHDSG